LEETIVEINAPGGHSLSRTQIKDTGTALWIDIPAYEGMSFLYATMLTPRVDPPAESVTEKKIGRHGSYVIYFDEGNGWQSYKASNERWQLSLLAYLAAGTDRVVWPRGSIEWLKAAVDLAEESPPECEGPLS
jgi:hypothetical protein